jgi:alpha-L-fucosidase
MPMPSEPITGDTRWFVRDRFGLFIHWGLYALPARHEWVKHREEMRDEDYQTYFDHFYPDLYDPAVWAREAKGAGMQYVVVTSKHHDGFCLWDSMSIFARDWASGFRLRWATRKDDAACETPVGG